MNRYMTHYAVYENGRRIYDGGTLLDCWKFLISTYPNLTIKEMMEDGILIAEAE